MKKLLYTGLLLATITLTAFSCEAEALEDEQQTEEFATEPGDSTSSGTPDDPEPDNGEE